MRIALVEAIQLADHRVPPEAVFTAPGNRPRAEMRGERNVAQQLAEALLANGGEVARDRTLHAEEWSIDADLSSVMQET